MSKIFKPRRGKASTMNGTKSSTVLAAGEMFIELPDTGVGTGVCKMKMGDGVTAYGSLPYAMGGDIATTEITGNINDDTSSTATAALANVTTGKTLGSIIGSLRRACSLNAAAIATLNDEVSGKGLTVDTVLDANSTNPATNSVITKNILALNTGISSITNSIASIAETRGSVTYSGNITASSYCPNYVDIPSGGWLVWVSGYATTSSQQEFTIVGLGGSSGAWIKGIQPVWYGVLNSITRMYIWNVRTVAINCDTIFITALRVKPN